MTMRILLTAALVVLNVSLAAFAQVRPVAKEEEEPTGIVQPAPATFQAKYEGGMFGYNAKEMGTLKFDDANSRLVFFGKDTREKFSIPYTSLLLVYPQSKSVTPTSATVVSIIPLPGAGFAGLLKEKRRYLILHIEDPDMEARGVINFKLDNRDLIESVIRTLGDKAGLLQRGDAYYRPRKL
jgi:hypothetical protein